MKVSRTVAIRHPYPMEGLSHLCEKASIAYGVLENMKRVSVSEPIALSKLERAARSAG